jgi:hypothetical protein
MSASRFQFVSISIRCWPCGTGRRKAVCRALPWAGCQPQQNLSRDLQAAAHAIGARTHVLHANTEQHVDSVFATIVWLRAGGLLIAIDPRRHSASTCRTTLLVPANEMIE